MNYENHFFHQYKSIVNKNSMIIYLIITFLFLSVTSIAQKHGKWNLKKDKNGIKVFVRNEPILGLPEYKGIMKIAAPMSRLVAALRDVDEYHNLFIGTKTAILLRKEEDLQICYMHNECPFPFSDRDGIYKSIFYRNAEGGSINISIVALPDYLPQHPKKVRIVISKGYWNLKPMNDGTVEVTYQQYADPGGNFPKWIIKLYSVNIPYKALRNLRRQVELPKYQHSEDQVIPITKYKPILSEMIQH